MVCLQTRHECPSVKIPKQRISSPTARLSAAQTGSTHHNICLFVCLSVCSLTSRQTLCLYGRANALKRLDSLLSLRRRWRPVLWFGLGTAPTIMQLSCRRSTDRQSVVRLYIGFQCSDLDLTSPTTSDLCLSSSHGSEINNGSSADSTQISHCRHQSRHLAKTAPVHLLYGVYTWYVQAFVSTQHTTFKSPPTFHLCLTSLLSVQWQLIIVWRRYLSFLQALTLLLQGAQMGAGGGCAPPPTPLHFNHCGHWSCQIIYINEHI